jgi:hypothetical protein
VTAEHDVKKEEKNAQSILNFTFKKLEEAIAHSGKKGKAASDAANQPRETSPGEAPLHKEGDIPCHKDVPCSSAGRRKGAKD